MINLMIFAIILILLYMIFFTNRKMIGIECILYPILIFIFLIILGFYWPSINNKFCKDLAVCISLILGLILYYFVMKKINRNTSLIDIYIYIYTLLNSYVMIFISGGAVFKGKELYWGLFTIVFYFINIIYFYYFKKDRLLKVVIMPTLISALSWVPIVLGWILLYWTK